MLSATETTSIVLRDVETIDEIKALEDLQIEAWGDDERDIVPLNQFAAARYVGGTLIGAFDGEKLVGFVYGFYGHIRGRVVHQLSRRDARTDVVGARAGARELRHVP